MEKELYVPPQIDLLELEVENVLCSSTLDMDPEFGNM